MQRTQVTPEEFVKEFGLLKQQYLAQVLADSAPASHAALLRQKLALTPEQQLVLPDFLSAVLTDVLYTVLLGLDGEAQIGTQQVAYTVLDEQGNTICGNGLGEVEAYAYRLFQGA